MSEKIGKIIYSSKDIAACVDRLGNEINVYYHKFHDLREEVVCIVVMNGAFVFASDLIRKFSFNVLTEFVTLSSYRGAVSQSVVTCVKTFDKKLIENKIVLVVEDIVDTGQTFSLLIKELKENKPRDLNICTLINRNTKKNFDFSINYTGFILDSDSFIVGYGMDYNSKYRNLPNIHELLI